MADNRYLVVEGVIGAGKTSLARMLSERLKARLVLEEVEENPFLKDFYRDREHYAFQTQMHFLFSRYQQQRALRQLNEAYNHFFFHYAECPLLVVNTNGIDFVNNPDDFNDLERRILSHREGTIYYAPLERGTAP